MTAGIVVCPFQHNEDFGYFTFGARQRTVVHIPSGYINATALVSCFNTKNNTRKEFYHWKNRNTKRINVLEDYVKTYAPDELIDYDDGSQSIMFIINHQSDLFDMDDTGKVILTKDKDTSLENETKTFYAIKGTYVHPILISYLLMYLDTTLEGIHATMVFHNYKMQSFKQAVLDNKLTPAQSNKCETQLTNEANTYNAHTKEHTVEEIEKDNARFEAMNKRLKNLFAAAQKRIKALEKANEDLTEENHVKEDKIDTILKDLNIIKTDNKKLSGKLDKIAESISKVTSNSDDLVIKIATNAALDPNKKEGVLIGFNTKSIRSQNVFEIHCGQQEYLDPIIKRYNIDNVKYVELHNIANSKSTLNQLIKELKLKRISNTCTFKNINNVERKAYNLLLGIDEHYQKTIGKVTQQVMDLIE